MESRIIVENCLTFPVNQKWFQVLLPCWAATNACHLIRRPPVREYWWIFRRTLWLDSKDSKYRSFNSTNFLLHSLFFILQDKSQESSDFLFWFSSETVMDQWSGDGRFSGWKKNPRHQLLDIIFHTLRCWTRRLLLLGTRASKIRTWRRRSVSRNRRPSERTRFCKSTCIFISSLSSRIESMEENHWRTASYVHSGEEWKTRTKSRSEMPVRTVSQKFSHPQWGRFFNELWGRPTTSADFGSSFWQISYPNNIRLQEDKIQDWGMYLFTISCGSYALDQRSGDGWISGWSIIFIINAEFWSTRCEDCFSTEQIHP